MSQSNRQRRNRDWVLFLVILLLGLAAMLCTGTLATGLAPQWNAHASMDSKLNPDGQYATLQSTTIVIEPVSADILTPPAWQDIFLTPQGTSTQRSNGGPAATSKPQNTPVVKETATQAASPQVTVTSPPTATGLPTATNTFIYIFPSKTYTPKPKNTNTLTPAPTQTPKSTRTRKPTKTPKSTKTPKPTETATITITSTATSTPTITFTPTVTLTPTITPTLTITPTVSPINFGPPDGNVDNPPDGTILTYCSLSPPIRTHSGDPGYDFVYYERAAAPGIRMDQVILRVSSDNGVTWTTVFNWGDNIRDQNSNLDFVALGLASEADNASINSADLVNGTGVGIDIDTLGLSGNYGCLQIEAGSTGGDGIDVDAIEIYP